MKQLYSYIRSFRRRDAGFALMIAALMGSGPVLSQPSAGTGTASTATFLAGGDIFGTHVFVENRGQFDHVPSDSRILYAMEHGPEKIYFTAKGLLFDVPDLRPLSKQERRDIERGIRNNLRPSKYVRLSWPGSNSDPEVSAGERQGHYITYGGPEYNSPVFKRIIYHNIYDSIDVEFIVPPGRQQGIKYSFITRGGDPGRIRLLYTGDSVTRKISNDGQLIISTGATPLAESPPWSYYTDDGSTVRSRFALSGDTASFVVDDAFDSQRGLVIDPWITLTASLTANQLAYDVDYDHSGRTFIYGGVFPTKVACYNQNGQLQWTFSGTINLPQWSSQPLQWIGNFGINKITGKVYIGQGVNTQGSQVVRLDQNGNYDSYISNQSANYQEVWDMGFHCVTGEVFTFGGGHFGNTSAATINSSNSLLQLATFQPLNNGAYQDIASHATDELGNIFVAYSTDNNSALSNKLARVNSTFNGNVWTQPSSYTTMVEAGNKLNYTSSFPALYSNGFNCLAVNSSFLFFYDGRNLAAYSKSTGSLVAATAFPNITPKARGGIAATDCNVLYLGGNGAVLTFSFNGLAFTPLSPMSLSLSTNPVASVFDIKLNKLNNTLYASGNGFVGTLSAGGNCVPAPGACSFNQPGVFLNGYNATCTLVSSATVTGFGGTGPYTYSWIPSGQTGSVASGLLPGTHSVVMTDLFTNLSYTTALYLSATYSLLPVSLSTSGMVSCHGFADASASVSVAGGSGQYYYYWNTGMNIITNTNSISNLGPGNYTVIVFDTQSGCESRQTFSITQPPPLTVTITASSPKACTGKFVLLNANCSGGTPGYQYNWSTGHNFWIISATSNVASTNIYSVNVTDSKGCSASAEKSVEFLATPTIVAANASICSQATATLIASGADSLFWNNVYSGPSITVSPATSSLYFVMGSTSGCTAQAAAFVSLLPAPVVSITSNSPLCSGNTLWLLGQGGYCSWSGPGGFSASGNTVVIPNIPPILNPVYELTVTAANSCTARASTTVMVSPSPTLTVPDVQICPLENGTLQASGAQTYTWNTNATNSWLTDSPSSTQQYTVAGSTGSCTSSTTAQIIVMTVPVPWVSSNSPVCSGQTLSLSAQGGASYQWSGPAGFGSILQSPYIQHSKPSNGGIYNVTVTAANSCTAAAALSVTVNPTPTVTASGGTACIHEAFVLNATGAAEYSWNDKNGPFATVKSPVILANSSSPLQYSVTGTTAGCSAQATTTVYTYPLPEVKAESISSATACLFGKFTVKGSGAMFYYWNGPGGLSFTGQEVTFQPTSLSQSGMYTLSASDVNNCFNTASVRLTVLNLPYVATPAPIEGCVPFCPAIEFQSQGTQPGIKSMSWEVNGNIFTTPAGSLCLSQPGFHPLRVSLTGDNGCSNTQSFTVKAYPKPPTGFSTVPPFPLEGEEIAFTATPDVNTVSWEWAFYPAAEGFTAFTWDGQQATYQYDIPGVFPVALVTRNKWGCTDSLVKPVTVGELYSVYIPNAFTPNLDGVNEVFIPVVRGVKGGHLAVYNRWGQKLFESADLYKGWDGTFRGAPCKDDVYTWTLRIDHRDGRKEERSGSVTLYK